MDRMDWLERTMLDPGFQITPLTPEIAILSTTLNNIHGDPVDRMLIATAMQNHSVLVTHDEKILEYAKQNALLAYDPLI